MKTYKTHFFILIFSVSPEDNPCALNNGGCTGGAICLLNYDLTDGSLVADCICPHLMKLSADKTSCDGGCLFMGFY